MCYYNDNWSMFLSSNRFTVKSLFYHLNQWYYRTWLECISHLHLGYFYLWEVGLSDTALETTITYNCNPV